SSQGDRRLLGPSVRGVRHRGTSCPLRRRDELAAVRHQRRDRGDGHGARLTTGGRRGCVNRLKEEETMFKTIMGRIGGVAAAAGLVATLAAMAPASAQDVNVLDQVIERGTVRIAIIGGNAPYSSITPSGEPEGYDIDI